MQPIDGRQLAAALAAKTKDRIAALGFTPGLGVLLVGDDAASHKYVSLKEKAAAAAGMLFEKRLLPASTTQEDVAAVIAEFNSREDIHGIIVQLPLPAPLNADAAIALIDPAKDADGFHPENVARFKAGNARVTPVLTAAIMALIDASGQPVDGRFALVIGNSQTFYEPLKTAFSAAGAFPVFMGADAPDIKARTPKAEIIVVAAGRAGLLTGDMFAPGTVVIDVGTNTLADGRYVGDVDAASCATVQGWLTPVPGGVGPVTVAMLLANTVTLAEQRHAAPKS
ncbi:MAG: Bifunctional protein FolD protein [Candidatus Parcubacteria bacterium]|jgi:methylenetetrahydrofolate dehydrogenase (NADP+)/methenyltetrahydrofolate cyclohydrolase